MGATVSHIRASGVIAENCGRESLVRGVECDSVIFLLLGKELPSVGRKGVFGRILISFYSRNMAPPDARATHVIASSKSPIGSTMTKTLLSFKRGRTKTVRGTVSLCRSGVGSLCLASSSRVGGGRVTDLTVRLCRRCVLGSRGIPNFNRECRGISPETSGLVRVMVGRNFVKPRVGLTLTLRSLVCRGGRVHLGMSNTGTTVLSSLNFAPSLNLNMFVVNEVPKVVTRVRRRGVSRSRFEEFYSLSSMVCRRGDEWRKVC